MSAAKKQRLDVIHRQPKRRNLVHVQPFLWHAEKLWNLVFAGRRVWAANGDVIGPMGRPQFGLRRANFVSVGPQKTPNRVVLTCDATTKLAQVIFV